MKSKILLSSLLASLLLVSTVMACSCIALTNAEDRYNAAEVVFKGRATEVVRMESYPVQQRVTFEVEKYWKNPSSNSRTLEVRTHEDTGANCGYNFIEGEEYIFYGYMDSETGKLTTTSCSQTMLVSESENEETELDNIRSPIIPMDNNDNAHGNSTNQNPPESNGNIFARFVNWLKNLFS